MLYDEEKTEGRSHKARITVNEDKSPSPTATARITPPWGPSHTVLKNKVLFKSLKQTPNISDDCYLDPKIPQLNISEMSLLAFFSLEK